MFQIWDVIASEPFSDAVYETGPKAAAEAQRLTELLGRKFQPRPLANAPAIDWQGRELSRFTSGEYAHLLPSLACHTSAGHFAHVSKKHVDLIAYTETDDKGNRDVQTRSKVVSYLQKFAPYLADHTMVEISDEHRAHFETIELQFAETADDIERVYTQYDRCVGPLVESCMRYKGFDRTEEHPVRVYAGHGMAVAYMCNTAGETTSRALVWHEGKVYSRVYGDGRLHTLLKAKGYRKGDYYSDRGEGDGSGATFAGAKFSAIATDYEDCDGETIWIMPYIDGPLHVNVLRSPTGIRYMQLSESGEIDPSNTDGLSAEISDENRGYCENCEESCDMDELRTVYNSRNYEMSWCDNCALNHAFYCHGNEQRYCDTVDSVDIGRQTYTQAYASDHFSFCDYSEEYVTDTDCVIIDAAGNDEQWGEDARENHAFTCSHDEAMYSNKLRCKATDGAHVATCNLEEYELALVEAADAAK